MRYDNGKEIKDFTAMDNEIIEKIAKIDDLSKLEKDVLTSLCRQIFWQDEDNVIRTSWWGAAKITATTVGCSERSVRSIYKELVRRNIISKRLEMREESPSGNEVPRVIWITINTDPQTWQVRERKVGVTGLCPVKEFAMP